MSDKFNQEAYDGDNDGFVQDGTPWERPVEDVLVDPTIETEEAPAEDVITSPEPVENTEPALAPVEDGVMGSATIAKKKATPKKSKVAEEVKPEKVAIHSGRNMSWTGVGKVYRGYNIVAAEQADKWLTKAHIRLATPEEVAQEFGK
jgi:hypothetical protein